MKTLARKLIEEIYIKQGLSLRIVVVPRVESGIPSHILNQFPRGVPLDLMPNRPLCVFVDDEAISMDLCFDGPPSRCVFKWSDIIAVGEVMTTIPWPSVLMEDGTLEPVEHEMLQQVREELLRLHPDSDRPAPAGQEPKLPILRVVKCDVRSDGTLVEPTPEEREAGVVTVDVQAVADNTIKKINLFVVPKSVEKTKSRATKKTEIDDDLDIA